jgi:hypothetical protein
MTPITPLEPGVEMFQRAKSQSFFFQPRTEGPRPISEATEFDTDFEDDSSDFEEDSPKYSFDSVSARKRKPVKQATKLTLSLSRRRAEEVKQRSPASTK